MDNIYQVHGGIIGPQGVGKTAFINSYLKRYDKGPLPEEPSTFRVKDAMYYESDDASVGLAELPPFSIPECKRYIKDHELAKFDFFIIMVNPKGVDSEFASCLVNLCKNDLKKPFFLVCSRFDQHVAEYIRINLNREPDELNHLEKTECEAHTASALRSNLPVPGERLFLIGRDDDERRHVYDFKELLSAISATLPPVKAKICGAVIGLGNTGKSAFINTFCELYDSNILAPEGDFAKLAPSNSKTPVYDCRDGTISLTDLPSVTGGLKERLVYSKKHKLKQFDFFVAFTLPRQLTKDKSTLLWLLELLQELKKPYFLVISKMDVIIPMYVASQTLGPAQSLEQSQTRDIAFEKAAQIIQKEFDDTYPDAGTLYLIGRHAHSIKQAQGHTYQYPLLRLKIQACLPKIKMGNLQRLTNSFPRKFADFFDPKITKRFQLDSIDDFIREVKQEEREMDNVEVKVAITGVSGSGKSALINSMCNLYGTEGYAEEGILETTTMAQLYTSTDSPLKIFDLPGVGTERFPMSTYAKDLNLQQYDFLLVMVPFDCTPVTRELYVKLYQRLKNELDKPCFLVASKIDVKLDAATQAMLVHSRTFNPNSAQDMQHLRTKVLETVKKDFPGEKEIYFIGRDSKHTGNLRHGFDFDKLKSEIFHKIDAQKLELTIRFLDEKHSGKWINKKEKLLKRYMIKYSLISSCAGLCPVPGVGTGVDAFLIGMFVQRCRKILCLEEQELRVFLTPANLAVFLPRIAAVTASVTTAVLLAGSLDDIAKTVPVAGTVAGMAVGVTTSGPLMFFSLSRIRAMFVSVLREVLTTQLHGVVKNQQEEKSRKESEKFLDDGINTADAEAVHISDVDTTHSINCTTSLSSVYSTSTASSINNSSSTASAINTNNFGTVDFATVIRKRGQSVLLSQHREAGNESNGAGLDSAIHNNVTTNTNDGSTPKQDRN